MNKLFLVVKTFFFNLDRKIIFRVASTNSTCNREFTEMRLVASYIIVENLPFVNGDFKTLYLIVISPIIDMG